MKVYKRTPSERASVPVVGDDLLTAGEVAALLRMTSAWVYAETRRNRIPHLRLGRYVRYRRSAIVAWMGEVEASSDASAADVPRLRFSS